MKRRSDTDCAALQPIFLPPRIVHAGWSIRGGPRELGATLVPGSRTTVAVLNDVARPPTPTALTSLHVLRPGSAAACCCSRAEVHFEPKGAKR